MGYDTIDKFVSNLFISREDGKYTFEGVENLKQVFQVSLDLINQLQEILMMLQQLSQVLLKLFTSKIRCMFQIY